MQKAMASWEHLSAMLSRSLNLPSKMSQAGLRPQKAPWSRWKISPFSNEEDKKNSSKMNERGLNVYENKGSDFHSAREAGMLLKTKAVTRWMREYY